MATKKRIPKPTRRASHPNSLANLRPYKPGQSGNPSGYPAGYTPPADWLRGLCRCTETELRAVLADPDEVVTRRAAAQALLLASASFGVNPKLGLIVVAIVMAVGGLLHSRRIATTMGERITEMNRGQGFIANLVASSLVIGATLMGSPVSTTHVSTGSIFGIGMWTKRTHWKVVGQILLAWVVTLPIAGLLAFALGTTLKLF